MIKRGEIYWVTMGQTVGAEIRKTRPALIVSNDLSNRHSQTVTVLPLSKAVRKVHPFEVFIKAGAFGHSEPCKVKTSQIRAIDKSRLGNLLGVLPEFLMPDVDRALRLHLGLG